MFRYSMLLLLVCSSALSGVEILPSTDVPPYQMIQLVPEPGERCFVIPQIPIDPNAESIPEPPLVDPVRCESGNLHWVSQPGLYLVLSFTESTQSQKYVRIRAPAPPAPPIPPEPTPDPTPDPTPEPQPDPEPDPSPPFPSPGLAVLVLHEAQDVSSLPAEQQAIFRSVELLEWCLANCVKLSDGEPAIRIWDDDYVQEQIAFSPLVFREAYPSIVTEAAGRLPWIAISNGKDGYSGPLPGSVQETLELLKKYGD